MRIKDHYKTLGISPAATLQDIKKAYRKLAFQYHPDQNPDNAFAEANFKEIQEAYSILSHVGKRRQYDEERWLMGMGNKAREQQAITPQWILAECRKLVHHMSAIDTYRMSHRSLRDYISLLLSDAHIGVLKNHNDTLADQAIIQEILTATHHMQYDYMLDVCERLIQIAPDQPTRDNIAGELEKHRKRAGFDKYFAFFILISAILLALFMYFYGRKR
ncbi:MAG: J domain-containing protein [Bacteroidetes bacterium]|nr:J domain-containing protein [Bacteroidota bacterium]